VTVAWFSRGDGLADVSPEARSRRLLVGGLVAACMVMSVVTLQGAFDAGDRKRALAALATTPAAGPDSPALSELLRQRNGGSPPRCSAEVVSAARGVTRVACALEADPVPWVFRWDDLRRDGLRPGDEATRLRLAR
jgi:hypothetical protein